MSINDGNAPTLANSAALIVLSRLATLVGVPAGLAITGWIGLSLVDLKVSMATIVVTVDSMQQQVATLQQQVVSLQQQVAILQQQNPQQPIK